MPLMSHMELQAFMLALPVLSLASLAMPPSFLLDWGLRGVTCFLILQKFQIRWFEMSEDILDFRTMLRPLRPWGLEVGLSVSYIMRFALGNESYG